MVGSTASVDEDSPAFGIGVGDRLRQIPRRREKIPPSSRAFLGSSEPGPRGKIAWILEDSSENADSSVYFGVVVGNYERVDCGTRAIGAGEPLICDDVILNVGFRSTPAKDLLMDIVIRGEYGQLT